LTSTADTVEIMSPLPAPPDQRGISGSLLDLAVVVLAVASFVSRGVTGKLRRPPTARWSLPEDGRHQT
jgi:hypothetical protein